jgi:hypothetical protein
VQKAAAKPLNSAERHWDSGVPSASASWNARRWSRWTKVWVCIDLDAAVLGAHYPAESVGKLHVVPNAVEVPLSVDPPAPPTRLVVTGVLDYLPNVLAVEFPVRRGAPALPEVVVAGAGRPAQPLPTAPNVRYHGPFEHVDEVMTGGVMAVPLTAGDGSRFKILEAFVTRVPVVSTAKGAEGLDVRDSVHLRLAEEPDEFLAAIDVCWRDTGRNAITAAALDLARRNHSFEVVRTSVAKAVEPFA